MTNNKPKSTEIDYVLSDLDNGRILISCKKQLKNIAIVLSESGQYNRDTKRTALRLAAAPNMYDALEKVNTFLVDKFCLKGSEKPNARPCIYDSEAWTDEAAFDLWINNCNALAKARG